MQVAMGEGVDAVEVSLHGRLEFRDRGVGLDAFHGAFGGLAHAQGPEVLVVLDHVRAEQRGELSPSCPAQKVHLPQALHGVHIAQSVHRVRFRVSIDVRHGHVVKHDIDVVQDGVGGEVKSGIRGNGLGGDGVIEAVPGKIMLAPTDKLANPMSSGSSPTQGQADNDGDASTAITAINTSKIELVQQRINLARTLAGSQYAAISNAIEHATDLSSQFGLGIDTISDVNFSMETAHLAKDRIQQDAAAAILAQANKAQEGLMMLV